VRRFHFNERPDSFEIDPQHQYAQQLVFAGLGRFSGGLHYHDSSLYGNTGTLKNMDPATDWVRDLGRWALDFNGSDDYVRVSSNVGIIEYPFTFAAWFNLHPLAGLGEIVSLVDASASDVYYTIKASVSAIVINARNGANGFVSATTVPTAGQWYHVVVSFLGNTVKRLYVNGVLENTLTTSVLFSTYTDTLLVGLLRLAAATEYFDGRLSDILVYNRALTPSEIAPLADPSNVMYSLGGSDPGLLRYRRRWWPVSSGSAPATTIRWPWQQRRQRRMAGHR
jgi:hypothetical protein